MSGGPPRRYYEATRVDLIDAVDGKGLRVLEIGCGSGATGAEALRRGTASEVVGVEMDPDSVGAASRRLTQVFEGDVETMDRSGFGTFDVILAGDVVEHLFDPWGTVRSLVEDHLSPHGQFIASIPNARCYAFWAPLVLRGRFEYTPSGLRDRTHLRWFTLSSIVDLYRGAGLRPAVVAVNRVAEGRRRPSRALGRVLGPFGVVQYVVKGTIPSAEDRG